MECRNAAVVEGSSGVHGEGFMVNKPLVVDGGTPECVGANEISHPIQDNHINMPHLPAQLISISNPNGHVSSHFQDELLQYHRDPPTIEYPAKTWKIPPKSLPKIN